MGPERKHLDSTIYFLSSLPNQIRSKKVFILIFSSKFSIHHASPPNKHILIVLWIKLVIFEKP